MKQVYIVADNIITSLGFSTLDHAEALENGISGLRLTDDPELYPSPVILSLTDRIATEEKFNALLEKYRKNTPSSFYTYLEKLMILSLEDVLSRSSVSPADDRTILVLSTTKGNIDLLEERFKAVFNHRRLFLWELARILAEFFGFSQTPLVISNACISGLVAISAGARYIQCGMADHAVIVGGDIVTEFVISGFQSFQSLSPLPCRPFDLNRDGLSLGEGSGALVLSSLPGSSGESRVRIAGTAITNDANHISGPSRTGEELACAVRIALAEASLGPGQVGYVSAHGTATLYNDEMEAKALSICGLETIPVNSYKGYWGHTLGAAGLIESIAAVHSLRSGRLFRSAGFTLPGVPVPLNVITKNQSLEFSACVKTASGFGGCNAAVVYQKC